MSVLHMQRIVALAGCMLLVLAESVVHLQVTLAGIAQVLVEGTLSAQCMRLAPVVGGKHSGMVVRRGKSAVACRMVAVRLSLAQQPLRTVVLGMFLLLLQGIRFEAVVLDMCSVVLRRSYPALVQHS